MATMATMIEIDGNILRTPEVEIAACWDNRTDGLLSRAAGVALMPYLNESARIEAAHDQALAAYEYGDAVVPAAPVPTYQVVVDGEEAVVSYEVERDSCGIFLNDGIPTGRIFVRTVSEVLRFLDGQS